MIHNVSDIVSFRVSFGCTTSVSPSVVVLVGSFDVDGSALLAGGFAEKSSAKFRFVGEVVVVSFLFSSHVGAGIELLKRFCNHPIWDPNGSHNGACMNGVPRPAFCGVVTGRLPD
jgi:hypothetical protein